MLPTWHGPSGSCAHQLGQPAVHAAGPYCCQPALSACAAKWCHHAPAEHCQTEHWPAAAQQPSVHALLPGLAAPLAAPAMPASAVFTVQQETANFGPGHRSAAVEMDSSLSSLSLFNQSTTLIVLIQQWHKYAAKQLFMHAIRRFQLHPASQTAEHWYV